MVQNAAMRTRSESDSIGSREIPADTYWGIHTARTLENFLISGRPVCDYLNLVRGLAMVKQASVRANAEIGVLDGERADLIARASQLVVEAQLMSQENVAEQLSPARLSGHSTSTAAMSGIA